MEGTTIILQQLLLGVAEELKLPLMQIARMAEAAELSGLEDVDDIKATADSALRLLDNYALGVRLALQHERLSMESVSVSSVLYDTGQQLDALARTYGVKLELNIAGRFAPVVAHRAGLQAALASLGASLIESLPANSMSSKHGQLTLQLATHRCRYGIVAGLYAETPELTDTALKKGRALLREGRQPLVNLSHTSGAGVFVADSILRAMDLRLSATRHHRLYGLGAVLQPNYQMQLV